MPKRSSSHPPLHAKAFVALAAVVLAASSCGAPNPQATPPRVTPPAPSAASPNAASVLSFAIREGRIDNRFFRQGRVAAHLLATSGESPRLVVAFPAGNMGIGLWFDGNVELAVDERMTAVERPDGMRGVRATVRARAPKLRLTRALLTSIRVLRHGPVHPSIKNDVVAGPPVVLRRTTLDGRHRLEVALEPLGGSSAHVAANGDVSLDAGPTGEIAIDVTGLTDEEPLTPLGPEEITKARVDDRRALEVLSFLSYREKLLAGSWQYLTYFGRDTLLSTRLLMPVLEPSVVEAALGAVIERLSADGEVAHEEDIGEWATIENLEKAPRPADLRQPIYDYKMVDDDFLLAPVLAAYVVDSPAGAARASAFFARRTTGGRTFAEAARKNLERVLAQAAPFAKRPSPETLIHIGEGLSVGNWRDSTEGLGNGRIPYDVNGALVPAALRAAERLYATDAFGRDAASAARAGELARAWDKAEALFRVRIEADVARARIRAYAAEQGIDPRDALAAVTGPVTFPALSLDARGAPITVQHSDDGFVMMFTEPSGDWLTLSAKRVVDPFPAGLRTPVGAVVANPAYAPDPKLRALFTRGHYHGTVVWSWQQAMLLAGLRRQLARTDLAEPVRKALRDAESALARVIDATKSIRTSELWSFAVDANGFRVVPFGQGQGHHTEANAAQLWSTVYLAIDAATPERR